jgi:hypothetical protein
MRVVELIQETKEDNIVWYAVYVDAEYITGSYSQKKANGYYKFALKSRFVKPAKVIKRQVIKTNKI